MNRAMLAVALCLLLYVLVPQIVHACDGKIDLVIGLDASGSVNDNEYKLQQKFAKNFVQRFSDNGAAFRGGNGLKVGMIMFNKDVKKLTDQRLRNDG